MRAARNLQPLGRDRDTFRRDLIDLFEERFRIDHHSVAEDARLVIVDNARRQQSQHECLIAHIDAVAGIMPALITLDDVEPVREKVNDLALSFIAPLGTDYYDYHILFASHSRLRSE